MANKINSDKQQVKRPDRDAGAGGRKERSNGHERQEPISREAARKTDEKVHRKGLYSRNGGYGGYRGL